MSRDPRVALSIPRELAADLERLAGPSGDVVELLREMLHVYQRYLAELDRFQSLQSYGASRAEELGVRTEQDVERLIQEARRG